MQWKVLKSSDIFKTGYLRLHVDECELPDGRVMPRYYVLEFPDWVNVVPVTDDGQVILVEQYRHAAKERFLEIPGGSSHAPGPEGPEDPRVASERELLEETGYRADEWVPCGFHYPNPALQNNRVHTYLALGCKKVSEPQLDPFEDLATVTMPVSEVVERWANGEFQHSIIAASIGMSLKHLLARGLIKGSFMPSSSVSPSP